MSWRAFRKGLQLVHLWVGLILAIPFILIGLTGSIIIATNVVRDYSPPAAPAKGEMQPMTSILAAAQKAAEGQYQRTRRRIRDEEHRPLRQ